MNYTLALILLKHPDDFKYITENDHPGEDTNMAKLRSYIDHNLSELDEIVDKHKPACLVEPCRQYLKVAELRPKLETPEPASLGKLASLYLGPPPVTEHTTSKVFSLLEGQYSNLKCLDYCKHMSHGKLALYEEDEFYVCAICRKKVLMKEMIDIIYQSRIAIDDLVLNTIAAGFLKGDK